VRRWEGFEFGNGDAEDLEKDFYKHAEVFDDIRQSPFAMRLKKD